MRVKYQIDEGDYVRAATLADRFSRPFLWYLLPYLLVIIPVLFILWDKLRKGEFSFGAFDVVIISPMIILLILYFGFDILTRFQKKKEYWESEDLQKEIALRIDEYGIQREGEGFMEKMSWDAADWWKEDDRVIMVCVPAYSMVIVPKRALDSKDDYTSLMVLLANKLGPPK
jgi:hypothetical protein